MTAYLSGLAVCAASLAAGAALCCGSRGWSWTAPATGLAALMLLALATVRLPGHGTTAAVAVALATIASIVVAARRRVAPAPLAEGVLAGAAILAICSLPFLAGDRIGELGPWINSDLAVHMAQAEQLAEIGADAHVTSPGYPNGPHAVVAALDGGLGVGASAGFTGLLLATPVLIGLTALGALAPLPWYLRLPGAILTAVPYLIVSYFAQGAFKEPLLALMVLGFVLALRELHGDGRRDAQVVVVLVLTTAGGLAVFGLAALAWPAAVLLWLGGLELLGGRRPALDRWPGRRWLPLFAALALVCLAIIAVIVATSDFFDTGPGRYLTSNDPGGNFIGQLSPLEAFGVWHELDFRESFGSGLLEPSVLLACAVVGFGLVWCWRRREWALLAGALAGLTLYAAMRPFTLAYFSGKALAIAAPLVTLVAVRALGGAAATIRLAAPRRLTPAAGLAAVALVAYLLVAGSSSTYALRGAHVRAGPRGPDLAAFRAIVHGQPTLYLARDDFAPWELRGAHLLGFQANNTRLAGSLGELPQKQAGDADPPAVDADSVPRLPLAIVRYVVTPRTPYASRMPDVFHPIARTRWHVLWERRGPASPREILAEGEAPGRVLDCNTARGRQLSRSAGVAYVRPAPVVGLRANWDRGALLVNGESRSQKLALGPGTWDISLRWFSDVPLELNAGPLSATLPAYVGDASSFASAGRVRWKGGPLRVTVTAPVRRRIEAMREIRLGTVAATPVGDPGRLVPLARACGRYVDWYRVTR